MYTVEKNSRAMIYISSFIKNSSDIQKLMEEIHRHTEGMVIS
jgi:ubiquinone/menaquinone biosynthesis C-methylase UbiE